MISLTPNEKINARRHCGYPAYGGRPSGFSSWRFFQIYGLLEYRLNNLAEGEIKVIRNYLGTLAGLEESIPRTSESLDTDRAAIWSRNQNETQDRERLFDGGVSVSARSLGFHPVPEFALIVQT